MQVSIVSFPLSPQIRINMFCLDDWEAEAGPKACSESSGSEKKLGARS